MLLVAFYTIKSAREATAVKTRIAAVLRQSVGRGSSIQDRWFEERAKPKLHLCRADPFAPSAG